MDTGFLRLMKIFSDKRFKEIVKEKAAEKYGDCCTEENVKEALFQLSSGIVSEYRKEYSCGYGESLPEFSAFAEEWIKKNYNKRQ